MNLEQRIEKDGKEFVLESLRVRLRFAHKRRLAIMDTIRIAAERLVEIDASIAELENDMRQVKGD